MPLATTFASTMALALLVLYLVWIKHDPPRTWWLDAIAPLAPWVFAALSVAPASCLILTPDARTLVLAVSYVAVYGAYWLVPTQLGRCHSYTGCPLRVVTANVLDTNRRLSSLVATLASTHATVICLQEVHPEQASAIVSSLGSRYPYRWLLPGPHIPTPGRSEGMAILSAVPFDRLGIVAADAMANPGQIIRLWVGDHPVGLVHGHLRIPLPRFCPVGPIRLPCGLDDSQRLRDARALAAAACELVGDVIVIGDLNATEGCLAYRLIARGFVDAVRAVTHGLRFTYPVGVDLFRIKSPIPLVRIDHILVRGALGAQRVAVGNLPGSDHRYVMADLDLQSEGSSPRK